MSHFNKRRRAGGLESVVNSLKQGVAQQKASLFNKENGSLMGAGLESASFSRAQSVFQANQEFVRNNLNGEQVTEAGLEAAAIILGGLADPATYLKASRKAVASQGVRVFGQLAAGSHGGIQSQPGLESFDTQEMTQHAQISIAYNLAAPRQDEFGEVLYPIIIATPDEAFFKVSVRRTTVWDGVVHDETGEVSKFKKSNVLDAYRDGSILLNEATKLVPYATNAKAEFLAPESVISTYDVEIGGVKVPTRPLVVGKRIGLVGIAQHPELIASGAMNQTDHIDRALNVAKLYVKVSKTGIQDQIVVIDASKMQGNQYYKSTEGMGYEGMLRFRPKSIVLDGSTKDHTGADVAAFADIKAAEMTVRLGATIDGDTNYEQGYIELRSSNVAPLQLADSNSTELPLTHSALAGVTFEIVYYTVDARLTNANRRVRGKMLDSDLWEEIYEVGLLAPLTIQFPGSLEAHDHLSVETLVEATHVQIASATVTSALNYAEHLNTFYRSNLNSLRAASIEGEGIEGIGRLLVTPFYEEIDVDLESMVNTLTSADKLADIRGFFIGLINEVAYRAAQKSGYIPALRQYTQDPKAKPTLLIATDQILPSFMFLTGDTRVAGPSLEYKIGTSPNQDMENTILLSFGGIEGDFCPLNFGNLIYVPELVSTVQMTRSGTLVNESTVQPRFRPVNNLPVMVKINVKGLSALIKDRTRLNVNHYTV